jgi:putative DNA methylase
MHQGEVITRRELPHWYVPGAAHFVTYRIAGTIPFEILVELQNQVKSKLKKGPPKGILAAEYQRRIHKQVFAAYDRFLDVTCRIDWLAKPEVASVIRENLYHHNGRKYHLLAYCVMPNHVHVLFQPINRSDKQPACRSQSVSDNEPPMAGGTSKLLVPTDVGETSDRRGPLASIMHSLKNYTAKKVNALLGRTGQFWQHKSYDHWARDDDELERIVEYIAWNPVKAGLTREPQEWACCSARDRFLRDGMRSAWLGEM